MAKFPLDLNLTTLTITPDDRYCDGTDSCVSGDGEYVEAVYMGLIGAAAVAAYRRFLRELAASPGAIELSVDELAISLGVPRRKLVATVQRLADFRVVQWTGSELRVPGLLPPVSERVLVRLSESAVRCHYRTVRAFAIQS